MNADAEQASPLRFDQLGLAPALMQALADVGYETPSPIQAETIPPLLEDRHVVGLAQTGTGKTAAFALPILSRLDVDQHAPQALILTPTRELALQVSEAFERYASHMPDVRVLPVYGGQGYGVQLSALRRGVHVIVGTPGRIIDHLNRGTLDLTQLSFLVLDEADEMLKMGFAEDVEHILADTPEDKQVALFSATMPKAIRRIADQYLMDAVEIKVKSETATADNITQRALEVSHRQKLDALTRILEVENFDAMIVFVRTKQATEVLAERLRARGFSATAINGDLSQQQRERAIGALKKAQLDILVATDVAARGLDVDRISHVVNMDIPTDPESYVHRIGRTGRAGRSGQAILFVTPRERHLLRSIEKATGQKVTKMTLPSVEDVNFQRLAKFDDAITAALDETDKVGFFRDVVSHYVRHHDVPEVDVAAALASVLQGDEPLLLDEDAHIEPADQPRERRERRENSGDSRFVTYKIAVGKRQKIEPRQIVGALANEGGLSRSDFGKILIRPEFSLVELPADLPQEAWAALKHTRISGKLIELQLDQGSPHGGARQKSKGQRPSGGKPRRSQGSKPRGAKSGTRKPRTKNPRRG